MTSGKGRGPGTAHTAVIIDSDDDLLTVLLPELRRSASRYGEILLVVGRDTRTVLAQHIGDLGGELCWGDPSGFYQRLGFAYEGFRRIWPSNTPPAAGCTWSPSLTWPAV
jgi:hypothetical protein